jgi:N-acetylglutamate synthase-like GNAT family acetyltransferase
MTPFEIVPAASIDQQAIRRLIRQVGINPTGLKWQNFLVVKDKNGRLIGCGQLKPHKDGAIELASIAVDESFRQQGLASQIINALLARQAPPIWLKCNAELTSFYEKFDFVHVTDFALMPPSFRRVYWIFTTLKKLFHLQFDAAIMVKQR